MVKQEEVLDFNDEVTSSEENLWKEKESPECRNFSNIQNYVKEVHRVVRQTRDRDRSVSLENALKFSRDAILSPELSSAPPFGYLKPLFRNGDTPGSSCNHNPSVPSPGVKEEFVQWRESDESTQSRWKNHERCQSINILQPSLFPRLPSISCSPHPSLSNLVCIPCEVTQKNTTEDVIGDINCADEKRNISKECGQESHHSSISKNRTNLSSAVVADETQTCLESNLEVDKAMESTLYKKNADKSRVNMDEGKKNSTDKGTMQINYRIDKKNLSKQLIQIIDLWGTHQPRPASNATVFLKSRLHVEDEENLSFMPYFGDDDKEDVVSDVYNCRRIEKSKLHGPDVVKNENNNVIDEVMRIIIGKFDNNNMQRNHKSMQLMKACEELSSLINVPRNQISERLRLLQRNNSLHGEVIGKRVIEDTDDTNDDSSNDSERSNLHESSEIKNSEENPNDYMSAMDSYRNLFCRRCLVYDCNIHGNIGQPDVQLQGNLALEKQHYGEWSEADDVFKKKIHDYLELFQEKHDQCQYNGSKRKEHISLCNKKARKSTESKITAIELNGLQKAICERTFIMYDGCHEMMASVMGCSTQAVSNYISEKQMTLKENSLTIAKQYSFEKKGKKKRKLRPNTTEDKSMKNYNPIWLKRVEDAVIHPAFDPCNHSEPCSEATCSCVQNAFFCTKHCVWGSRSRNFFRGCACRGNQCRTMSCPCFAARRECDPDLCKTCGACTDPSCKPASKQHCRNDNLSMRRHVHLLLSESGIGDAGWGLYTKHSLKRGDFIHEYLGEVISQEEAERRGRIYDKVNRSYLFNLTSDMVIDASRKGNKTKFINHSSKPNCYTRIVVVNGDTRIGLFAKENIDPQTELFFDYRYDVTLDNDLIIKPGKTVDWMKNPKMANKISKKIT